MLGNRDGVTTSDLNWRVLLGRDNLPVLCVQEEPTHWIYKLLLKKNVRFIHIVLNKWNDNIYSENVQSLCLLLFWGYFPVYIIILYYHQKMFSIIQVLTAFRNITTCSFTLIDIYSPHWCLFVILVVLNWHYKQNLSFNSTHSLKVMIFLLLCLDT
jgi:hypothetical protein